MQYAYPTWHESCAKSRGIWWSKHGKYRIGSYNKELTYVSVICRICFEISLKFVLKPQAVIDSDDGLVPSNKPLYEPMLAKFIDAFMRQSASLSLIIPKYKKH